MCDLVRCFGTGNKLYERYHDEEWGRWPKLSTDERELFERLCLEAFQSGLSWLTVLSKRTAFRTAFACFAPAIVAGYGETEVARLLADPSVIRNERKIRATIVNAQALIALHKRGIRLAAIFEEYRPIKHLRPNSLSEVSTSSPESTALAKRLKQLGFSFIGPTTAYSLLQALGIVDDHIASCWLVQKGKFN